MENHLIININDKARTAISYPMTEEKLIETEIGFY